MIHRETYSAMAWFATAPTRGNGVSNKHDLERRAALPHAGRVCVETYAHGGLGNQIYQTQTRLAAGRLIASRLQLPLCWRLGSALAAIDLAEHFAWDKKNLSSCEQVGGVCVVTVADGPPQMNGTGASEFARLVQCPTGFFHCRVNISHPYYDGCDETCIARALFSSVSTKVETLAMPMMKQLEDAEGAARDVLLAVHHRSGDAVAFGHDFNGKPWHTRFEDTDVRTAGMRDSERLAKKKRLSACRSVEQLSCVQRDAQVQGWLCSYAHVSPCRSNLRRVGRCAIPGVLRRNPQGARPADSFRHALRARHDPAYCFPQAHSEAHT